MRSELDVSNSVRITPAEVGSGCSQGGGRAQSVPQIRRPHPRTRGRSGSLHASGANPHPRTPEPRRQVRMDSAARCHRRLPDHWNAAIQMVPSPPRMFRSGDASHSASAAPRRARPRSKSDARLRIEEGGRNGRHTPWTPSLEHQRDDQWMWRIRQPFVVRNSTIVSVPWRSISRSRKRPVITYSLV